MGIVRERLGRNGLLALALMAVASPAGAGGDGGGGGGNFFNTFTTARTDCSDGCTGPVGDQGTAVAFSNLVGGRVQATATANAAMGFVRAFARVSVEDELENPTGFAAAVAEGEFEDRFVIDGGPLNGTDGSMDFLVHVGGGGLLAFFPNDETINPFPSADARHVTRASLEASCFGCEVFAELFGDTSGSGDARGTFGETLDFVFGEPIVLHVEGISSATAQGEGIATADFANTIEWGGIPEIRAADGSPVVDFVVTSDSGVDWSEPVMAPVPEPSSVAMGVTGGALLLLQLRLRRRSGARHRGDQLTA